MPVFQTPRVTIYDQRIQRAFLPGGSLFQNVRRVGNTNLKYAREEAPKRTGKMAAALKMSVTPSGKLHARYTVNTNIDYAIWTLRGTKDVAPIRATNKSGINPTGFLWVRPRPHSWYAWNREPGSGGRTPRAFVDGQDKNDWLKKSVILTFHHHRLL